MRRTRERRGAYTFPGAFGHDRYPQDVLNTASFIQRRQAADEAGEQGEALIGHRAGDGKPEQSAASMSCGPSPATPLFCPK